MKVNGNDPTISYEVQESGLGIAAGPQSNIPIRLEIAARILAGSDTTPDMCNGIAGPLISPQTALELADALIAAYNASVKDAP